MRKALAASPHWNAAWILALPLLIFLVVFQLRIQNELRTLVLSLSIGLNLSWCRWHVTLGLPVNGGLGPSVWRSVLPTLSQWREVPRGEMGTGGGQRTTRRWRGKEGRPRSCRPYQTRVVPAPRPGLSSAQILSASLSFCVGSIVTSVRSVSPSPVRGGILLGCGLVSRILQHYFFPPFLP